MFIRCAKYSIKKYGENAFGDSILIKRNPDSGKLTGVLSDGLGSGIKANILSKLTSTMLMGFSENNADIIKSAEIVMNTLPVCQVRKISYSTFSLVEASKDGSVRILEEGNPDFLWIHDNKIMTPECEIIDSKTFKDRHLKVYNLKLQEGDILVFVSDGVVQAGLGSKYLKEGVKREGLIKFVLEYLQENKDVAADGLSKYIVDRAKSLSIDFKPKDDISALVLIAAKMKSALIYTGPPYDSEKDDMWAKTFFEFEGKKAVSGGTTANILSEKLKTKLYISQEHKGNLPAISFMEGCDLVTEGILTLTKTLEYLQTEEFKTTDNAASSLAKFLLEADLINFVVGAKVNMAHYDPNFPVEIELRKDVVKKIAKILKDKYLKYTAMQFI